MQQRELYHGTNGDNILRIIFQGQINPGGGGTIFFSQWRFDSAIFHGADLKRKASFAVRVRVDIPDSASVKQEQTPGVRDTLVIETSTPLPAAVLELYVRNLSQGTVSKVRGETAIVKFLSA